MALGKLNIHKINSQLIEDFNVTAKAPKRKLCEICLSNYFIDTVSKAHTAKAK